jgi:hypothetical protein
MDEIVEVPLTLLKRVIAAMDKGYMGRNLTEYTLVLNRVKAALQSQQAETDTVCLTHPDAPHGFSRHRSLNEDRYVCECEGWEPEAAAEPVAWMDALCGFDLYISKPKGVDCIPLYRTPPPATQSAEMKAALVKCVEALKNHGNPYLGHMTEYNAALEEAERVLK